MKISYAITVCNELEEISRLLNFLHQYKRAEDEIVVLLDKPKASQELLNQLNYWYSKEIILLKESEFKGHFADWKNELNNLCSGDYIYQIDADEMVSKSILEDLPQILEYNDVDVVMVPRINTVKGLTQKHIDDWRWLVDEKGRINFPDYQWRIYKNIPNIKWVNKVHERLDGFKTISRLPDEKEFCLLHEKTIEKQEKQNNYYNTL